MDSDVRFVKNNLRYRLVNKNWDFYLLDTEKNMLPIFFPFLFWFTKQKMYKINMETMKSLRARDLHSNQFPSFRWWHLSTVLFYYLMMPIFDYVIISSKIRTLSFFVIFAGIIILLRFFYHRWTQNRFPEDKIDLNQLEKVTVKVKPKDTKQYLIQILMPLIFDLAILISVIGYIQEGSLGFLLIYFFFVPLRLFIFTLFFANPAIEKRAIYEMKLVDE
ncbi:MAG: DUF443 family protein [Atopostipes sp.]|nr:DUF443 family protein [Atopostipes sp.]